MWRRYVIIVGTAFIVLGLILASVLDLDARGPQLMPGPQGSLTPHLFGAQRMQKMAGRAEAWLVPWLRSSAHPGGESAATLPASQP
jgi:hypothetical protein